MIAESNVVPNGYKQTEVGVIPSDWDVQRFDSIAEIERGKFTARPRNDPKYYGGDIPFIQTGDITRSDGWIRTHSQTLNNEGLRVSKRFPKGTLFFTIAANIGDVAISTFETACPDSLVAIKTRKHISKFWLKQELRRRKTEFENLATHNAQLNINLEKLEPYPLPVPPLAEQEAIAEALGDADALIESLEHLVAKKRHLKQAAMQQLLTGKKRLPGFEEEWVEKDLAGLLKSYRLGGNYPNTEVQTSFPLMKMGNVERGDFNTNKVEYVPENVTPDPHDRLRRGDVVFNTRNTLDLVGKIAIWREELPVAYFNSNLLRFDFDPALVGSHFFMNFLMNSTALIRRLRELATGTTSVAAIYTRDLLKVRLRLPSDRDEQIAIADVIEDMAGAVAVLESKLAKARQIKQGMMQELLTGRTRLV